MLWFVKWISHLTLSLLSVTPRYFNPNWCFRHSELWSGIQSPMVSVAVAIRVDWRSHYGQGSCPYCTEHCSMGTLPKGKLQYHCKMTTFSIVTVINNGSCRDEIVMCLLRQAVKKWHWPVFLTRAGFSCLPTPWPFSILQMISPNELDWLSPHFYNLLKETFSLVTMVVESTSSHWLLKLALHTNMHVCTCCYEYRVTVPFILFNVSLPCLGNVLQYVHPISTYATYLLCISG